LAWRNVNNNSANRIEIVVGIADICLSLSQIVLAQVTNSSLVAYFGIGEDQTASTGLVGGTSSTTANFLQATLMRSPSIGYHYYQAVELCTGSSMSVNNGANEGWGIIGTVQGM
jgi:hypothetical protein